jgi:hypothetical protein
LFHSQVWGQLKTAIDGTPAAEYYDSLQQSQPFVVKYINVAQEQLKANGTAGNVLVALVDGDLAEGMYNMSVKASLLSKFPTLIAATATSVNQTDAGSEVKGSMEYFGECQLWADGADVGLLLDGLPAGKLLNPAGLGWQLTTPCMISDH